MEAGEQGIVLVERLAESEAGIENYGLARDPGGKGRVGPLCEFAEDEGHHFAGF